MFFLLLILAAIATTSSQSTDKYLWKIRCDSIDGKEAICYIPGMTVLEMHYYQMDLLETYPHERDYLPCTSSFFDMRKHNDKPAIRVGWACHALFGIKPKVTGFPYKGQCGQNNYGYKIIKGSVAKECQFPWMAYVQLYWKDGYRSSCGGSIISDRWILTAGHCIIKQGGDGQLPPADVMNVRTGSLYKWEHYIRRSLKRLVVHPRYDHSRLTNDIALMELTKPIKWDGCHAPVCLNKEKDVDKAKDLTCMISGWGASHPSNAEYPKYLKWAYDNILSRARCNAVYGSHSSDNTLCGRSTSNGNGGFCSADSGGPLVCKSPTNGRFYQHGIVRAYLGSVGCRMEGLYTSVAALYDWITSIATISE